MIPNRLAIREEVVKLHRLSTIPQANSRILAVLLDDRSNAEDLANELAKDQAITAKVLRLVNSAYYGFFRQISSVKESVTILGYNEIRRIVLTASVYNSLRKFGGKVIERKIFWEHSLACAAAAEILNRECATDLPAAYFAGLLHDIGKVILDEFFSQAFEKAFELSLEKKIPLYEAEREVMDTDHAEVGFWLAERWNLPLILSDSICFHHAPRECEHPSTYSIVNLISAANALAKILHASADGEMLLELPVDEGPMTASILESAKRELLQKKPAILNLYYGVTE